MRWHTTARIGNVELPVQAPGPHAYRVPVLYQHEYMADQEQHALKQLRWFVAQTQAHTSLYACMLLASDTLSTYPSV